jgi:hypothetical protein
VWIQASHPKHCNFNILIRRLGGLRLRHKAEGYQVADPAQQREDDHGDHGGRGGEKDRATGTAAISHLQGNDPDPAEQKRAEDAPAGFSGVTAIPADPLLG